MKLPKDDIGKLVLSYKTAKGIPHDNEIWNKVNWGHAAKRAKQLLEICENDFRTADACLLDLAGMLDDADRYWTFETILKLAFDWLTKKKGPHDAKTRARQGLLNAVADERTKELAEGNGTDPTPRALPDKQRDLPAIPEPRKEVNQQRAIAGNGSVLEELL